MKMESPNAESTSNQDLDDSGYVQDASVTENGYKGQAHLLDLSDDVLLLILKNCSPRDLKALGHTCPRLGALVCDRTLWTRVDARANPIGEERLRWYMTHCLSPATRELQLKGYAKKRSKCLGIQDLHWPMESESGSPRLSRIVLGPRVDVEHFLLRMWYPHLPRFAVSPRWPDKKEQESKVQKGPGPEAEKDGPSEPGPSTSKKRSREPCEDPSSKRKKRETSPFSKEFDDLKTECKGPQFTLTSHLLRDLRNKCSKLTSLTLEYCNIDYKTTNICQFPPTLKKLSLRGTLCYNLPVNTSYLGKIQDRLPGLEYLDVSECDWFESASLMPLSKLPLLKELYMRDCKRLSECVAYASLATRYGFRELKVMDVRGSPLADSEISALGWLPLLEELYCSPPEEFISSSEHTHSWKDIVTDISELDHWEKEEPEYYKMKTPEPSEDVEEEEIPKDEPETNEERPRDPMDDVLLGNPWLMHERRIIVIQPNANRQVENQVARERPQAAHVGNHEVPVPGPAGDGPAPHGGEPIAQGADLLQEREPISNGANSTSKGAEPKTQEQQPSPKGPALISKGMDPSTNGPETLPKGLVTMPQGAESLPQGSKSTPQVSGAISQVPEAIPQGDETDPKRSDPTPHASKPMSQIPDAMLQGAASIPQPPNSMPQGPDSIPQGPDTMPQGLDAIPKGAAPIPQVPDPIPQEPDPIPQEPVPNAQGPDPMPQGLNAMLQAAIPVPLYRGPGLMYRGLVALPHGPASLYHAEIPMQDVPEEEVDEPVVQEPVAQEPEQESALMDQALELFRLALQPLEQAHGIGQLDPRPQGNQIPGTSRSPAVDPEQDKVPEEQRPKDQRVGSVERVLAGDNSPSPMEQKAAVVDQDPALMNQNTETPGPSDQTTPEVGSSEPGPSKRQNTDSFPKPVKRPRLDSDDQDEDDDDENPNVPEAHDPRSMNSEVDPENSDRMPGSLVSRVWNDPKEFGAVPCFYGIPTAQAPNSGSQGSAPQIPGSNNIPAAQEPELRNQSQGNSGVNNVPAAQEPQSRNLAQETSGINNVPDAQEPQLRNKAQGHSGISNIPASQEAQLRNQPRVPGYPGIYNRAVGLGPPPHLRNQPRVQGNLNNNNIPAAQNAPLRNPPRAQGNPGANNRAAAQDPQMRNRVQRLQVIPGIDHLLAALDPHMRNQPRIAPFQPDPQMRGQRHRVHVVINQEGELVDLGDDRLPADIQRDLAQRERMFRELIRDPLGPFFNGPPVQNPDAAQPNAPEEPRNQPQGEENRPRNAENRRNPDQPVHLDFQRQSTIHIGHAGYLLVSDSAILRFGRADNDNVNYVNIGPNGIRAGEPGTRPDRSNLRILSATGYRNITDRSLVHLATAAPHITWIDFSQTNVTPRGVETFKALRPNCEVIFSQHTKSD